MKKAGRKPLHLLSSVQNTLCIEYGKVRFIFCERVKRRPHRQRSSSVSIIIAARGREKLRIVGIIVIAGTQPDYTRLTALLYIVTQAQKKLNRFCHSERSAAQPKNLIGYCSHGGPFDFAQGDILFRPFGVALRHINIFLN